MTETESPAEAQVGPSHGRADAANGHLRDLVQRWAAQLRGRCPRVAFADGDDHRVVRAARWYSAFPRAPGLRTSKHFSTARAPAIQEPDGTSATSGGRTGSR